MSKGKVQLGGTDIANLDDMKPGDSIVHKSSDGLECVITAKPDEEGPGFEISTKDHLLDPGTIAKQLNWMTLDVFWLIKHNLLKDSRTEGQLPMILASDVELLKEFMKSQRKERVK